MTVKECPVCYKIIAGNGERQCMLFLELHVTLKHVDTDDES